MYPPKLGWVAVLLFLYGDSFYDFHVDRYADKNASI